MTVLGDLISDQMSRHTSIDFPQDVLEVFLGQQQSKIILRVDNKRNLAWKGLT